MKQIYLKEVAEISAGQGAPQGEKYFDTKGHPFVRAGSLDLLLNGYVEDSLEKINNEIANEYKLRLFPKGTILFAKSGMSSTKDRVYMLKSECYIVNHLASIITNANKINSTFLTYWLRQFRPSRLIKDNSYPSIRLSDIQEIKIPLFPMSSQHKIASILEKCESAIEKRKTANRLTDEFLKSVFLEMFGDPVKNPKSWKINKIQDFIEEIKNESPSSFPNKTYDYIDISSIDNVIKKIVNINKIVGNNAPSRARQLVKTDDILVSTVRPNLNAVAVVSNHFINPIASTGFCVLRTNKNSVKTEYLFEICKMPFFIAYLTRVAKGASYPAVTDSDVKNIRIPVPSLSEQQKFANIVQKVEKLKEKQHESEKELNNLFNSLMQKSFRDIT